MEFIEWFRDEWIKELLTLHLEESMSATMLSMCQSKYWMIGQEVPMDLSVDSHCKCKESANDFMEHGLEKEEARRV